MHPSVCALSLRLGGWIKLYLHSPGRLQRTETRRRVQEQRGRPRSKNTTFSQVTEALTFAQTSSRRCHLRPAACSPCPPLPPGASPRGHHTERGTSSTAPFLTLIRTGGHWTHRTTLSQMGIGHRDLGGAQVDAWGLPELMSEYPPCPVPCWATHSCFPLTYLSPSPFLQVKGVPLCWQKEAGAAGSRARPHPIPSP